MEIIPAIDLLAGRCVRLYQGDFRQVTEYETDPLVLANRYRDAGARRLHVIDLDGARSGTAANREIVRTLAAQTGMAVQVGGGIRSLEALQALVDAGIDRVVVGSVAVKEPQAVCGWLRAVGAERLVIGLDVRVDGPGGAPEALIHGWQEGGGLSLWDLAKLYAAAGARHVLCTDIARDGTLGGPNLDLYAECVRRFPGIGWIASGGLGSAADLAPLAATGVASVVTGKALLDGRIDLEEIRRFSRAG
jgi:phosphoribosylformimino-5-aminoimidazole carboxamide ribotide isomerase